MTTSLLARPPRLAWSLADAIGVSTLQAIQDAFARAFGLPTVIVDSGGNNVTEITHRVAFCEDLTRPSRGGTRCKACDTDAMRRAESTGRPAIFCCWNRLYDCAIPIASSDGQLFGYFLCGQIFTDAESRADYAVTARELGVDEGTYVAAAEEVRVVPRVNFERSVEAMGVLARMIGDQASASIQNLAVLEQALEARTATDRLTRELDTIVEASGAIAAAGDAFVALERIADSISRVVPCDSCIILELEPDRKRLRPLTVRDPYADAIAAWCPDVGVGIPGLVAQHGTALRIDDVPGDPRFVPVPGVPVEPEAILAVPMLFDGEVTGVITVSRLKHRTFSDHELDVLKILAAQSAIALATATFRDQIAQRLEVERAQGELARRIDAGGPLEPLLSEVVANAHRLLDCTGAVIRIETSPGVAPRPIGMSKRAADALARAHADERERARTARRPVLCEYDGSALLVAPVETASRPIGEVLLLRPRPFSESDVRLAVAIANLAGTAAESARAERTSRRLRTGYTLLAEVGAEITASHSSDEIIEALLRRGPELVGGVGGFVAVGSETTTEIDVYFREDGNRRRRRVDTAGHPRLRLPQPDEALGYRDELLNAWSVALAEAIRWRKPRHMLAAPLMASGGALVGAFVVVAGRAFGTEEHRLLAALTHTAAAGLAARGAEQATDQVLRNRATGLRRLTASSQRIAAAQDRQQVAAAVFAALRELADVSAAAIVVQGTVGPQIFAAIGLSQARAARLAEALPHGAWDAVTPIRSGTALAIPMRIGGRCGALLVAMRPPTDADDEVLSALGRHGALAWDSAERLEAAGRSLAELRNEHRGRVAKASELERSLAIQRALSEAGLEERGIATVTETLARLQGGRVAIYDADLNPVAGSPDPPAENQPIAELLAREREIVGGTPLEIELAEGQALLAAPIQAEGERLGWLVHQLSRSFGEVDRAAVAHAATAVALAMLRARTADEVEARMTGEFLQSLLAGEATADELVRRGRALTYDLTQPSRVVVIARADQSAGGAERLYREAARCTRGATQRFFVATRGNELTILGPAEPDWTTRLYETLTPAVGSVLVGVGPIAQAPAEYQQSFLDARQCVRALRSLGRDGILSLDGDGLEQLLLRTTDTTRLTAFMARFVSPLKAHDAARRSALIPTLDLVFKHGWNLQAAARAAHIHVSTLRYRLSRVEAIVGIDLRQPEDRLALELALRTSRLLAAADGPRAAP